MSKRRNRKWQLRVVVAAFVALLLSFAVRHAHAREILGGPFYYHFGSEAPADMPPASPWKAVDGIDRIPQTGGDRVWITTRLPTLEPHVTLFVPRVYLRFRAYLDGELIGSAMGPHEGTRAWHVLELPDDASGRWLCLEIESDYVKTGLTGHLAVGERYEHIETLLRDDAPRLVMILIALLLAAAGVSFALRGVERQASVGFAAWALGVGLWNMFYVDVREILLPAPILWLYVWVIGLALLTPAFLWFFRAAFAPQSRFLRVLFLANAGSSLLGVAIVDADLPAWLQNSHLALVRLSLGVAFVVVIVMLVQRVRRGDRDARALAFGMVLYAGFSFHDLALSMGWVRGFDTVAYWGTLCFLTSGAWILIHRLSEMRRRHDQYARAVEVAAAEREMMLRDLHDGLGRITTGISMLTEVARRSADKERPLETIAGLADEGTREIRTFMRGLEPASCDWPALTSAMRAHATPLVEAVGGRFELSVDVPEQLEDPSPFLFVQLLRVFQEGITNALKNADAPTIEASLEVTDTIVLLVRNDGVSERAASNGMGVGLGAGLDNMRARARTLGGELSFDLDAERATATLELSIPWPLQYDFAPNDGDAPTNHPGGGR